MVNAIDANSCTYWDTISIQVNPLPILNVNNTSSTICEGENVSLIAAIAVEFLFTFALALTVLNVATAKGTEGNSFYGLAIGFMVMCGAFAGGGISGGAFNPAVGIGLSAGAFFEGAGGAWVLLYIFPPLLGGIAAAYIFKIQGNEDIQ